MNYEDMFVMMNGGMFGFGWFTYLLALSIVVLVIVFFYIFDLKKIKVDKHFGGV